jgi:hypothetical protein
MTIPVVISKRSERSYTPRTDSKAYKISPRTSFEMTYLYIKRCLKNIFKKTFVIIIKTPIFAVLK